MPASEGAACLGKNPEAHRAVLSDSAVSPRAVGEKVPHAVGPSTHDLNLAQAEAVRP